MPVGNPNIHGRSKKKEEVSHKLQEIKQRQQNWLRQREQSKQQEEHSPKPKPSQNHGGKSAPVTGSTSKLNVSPVPVGSKKGGTSVEKTQPHVRERFKHWINARNTKGKEEIEFNDNNSIRSGAESELERLVSPDLITERQPVPEDDFDNLAEKIASRVKSDLGISSVSGTSTTTDITLIEDENVGWDSTRCRTFTQEVPTFNHLGTSALTSHSCTVCKKLMLSSKNIPMMVIPCGHTLCKTCSEGRKTCPSCDCPIVSLTVNIMLQQVIQEYHAHPVPSSYTLESSDFGATHKQETPGADNYSPAKYVEDNRRNRMASYKTQLANLQTRHDVLSSEHVNLLDKHKRLSTRLHHEQAQIRNIITQEEEIKKTILQLQERQASLQEHRHQIETQVTELEDEKVEMEGKLTLLSTTVTSLVREVEKVKLLSEGENETGNT